MTKVVYSGCFGGFGLSDAAVRRYAEIKGVSLYPETRRYGFVTYWTIPPIERVGIIDDDDWYKATVEQRQASNEAYSRMTIEPRAIPRTDPALVQVIEELGEAANGEHAKLLIAEVPEGERYRIDEYDGNESVMTVADYEWQVA